MLISIFRVIDKDTGILIRVMLLLIIITHNSELTKMADHVFGIKNGKISFEQKNDNPTPVEELVW